VAAPEHTGDDHQESQARHAARTADGSGHRVKAAIHFGNGTALASSSATPPSFSYFCRIQYSHNAHYSFLRLQLNIQVRRDLQQLAHQHLLIPRMRQSQAKAPAQKQQGLL
jgi:hypothetical protein